MSRSERINVSLRFRPLNQREVSESEQVIWRVTQDSVTIKPEVQQVMFEAKRLNAPLKTYMFSQCFTPKHCNEEVYQQVVRRVVQSSLEGYNGTIFAYGQTGSGKTYTLMGSDGAEYDRLIDEPRTPIGRESPGKTVTAPQLLQQVKSVVSKAKGVIILALQDLFATIQSDASKSYYLTCSYLEIYNEQIYDLLVSKSEFTKTVLTVNEDAQRGFYVKGLSLHVVQDLDSVLRAIARGEENRHYAATAMNHHSSRSHTIFRLQVSTVKTVSTKGMMEQLRADGHLDEETEELSDEQKKVTSESVLNFVDLAGSERLSNLHEVTNPLETIVAAEGKRSLKISNLSQSVRNKIRKSSSKSPHAMETLVSEGKHINTSLFYLWQVIAKLSERDTTDGEVHIPYRNSNLTKILRSSLGGNSLTCIICTATPTAAQFEMTLSTLRFAGIASNVTNEVAANIISDKHIEIISAYQKDIETLRRQLDQAVLGGKSTAEEAEEMRKRLEERILRLTQMVFTKTTPHAQKVQTRRQKAMDLWVKGAGDLTVDSRLMDQRELAEEGPVLGFDDKGKFAFERMKLLHNEKSLLDKDLQELSETNKYLLDSKVNVSFIQLKNDLKKSVELSAKLSEKKNKYKKMHHHKCEQLQTIQTQVMEMEKLQGLERLSQEQLMQFERYLYGALDTVKVKI